MCLLEHVGVGSQGLSLCLLARVWALFLSLWVCLISTGLHRCVLVSVCELECNYMMFVWVALFLSMLSSVCLCVCKCFVVFVWVSMFGSGFGWMRVVTLSLRVSVSVSLGTVSTLFLFLHLHLSFRVSLSLPFCLSSSPTIRFSFFSTFSPGKYGMSWMLTGPSVCIMNQNINDFQLTFQRCVFTQSLYHKFPIHRFFIFHQKLAASEELECDQFVRRDAKGLLRFWLINNFKRLGSISWTFELLSFKLMPSLF